MRNAALRLLIALAAVSAVGAVATCRAAPSPAASLAAPAPPPTPTPVIPEFECKTPADSEAPLTVFISDLHFGLGHTDPDKKTWNALEDFRWSNALKGFLTRISDLGGKKTTLVIAGDMLEMWQHPGVCDSGDADHGCTMKEARALVGTIVKEHADDLHELGRFANDGENHLVIIPGNHDAALLKSEVNKTLLDEIKGAPGRAEIVANGVWASPDCAIVSEHGHQMPNEQINGWKRWPYVTEQFKAKNADKAEEYFIRPWGEYFVHELYDKVETDNSLIDNLIPQSNGVRHYMAKQGTVESAKDIARFLAFNIGEASLRQVGDLKVKESGPPEWDVKGARDLGWKLFNAAADTKKTEPDAPTTPDAEFLRKIGDSADPTWDPIRKELDALAHDEDKISDDDIKGLCDKAAANKASVTCPLVNKDLVISSVAGAIPGAHSRAMISHLTKRAKADAYMRVFVYGHTHELRCPVSVKPKTGLPVSVANTGAFQRLIDDSKYIEAAKKKNFTPEAGLGGLKLEEDAPPCYSAVLVTYADGVPVAKVQNWYMDEHDGDGKFVDPTDCLCAKLDPKCEPKKNCP